MEIKTTCFYWTMSNFVKVDRKRSGNFPPGPTKQRNTSPANLIFAPLST
jgi:hypothetical protein